MPTLVLHMSSFIAPYSQRANIGQNTQSSSIELQSELVLRETKDEVTVKYTNRMSSDYCLINKEKISDLITFAFNNNFSLRVFGTGLWNDKVLEAISPHLDLSDQHQELFEGATFSSVKSEAQNMKTDYGTVNRASSVRRLIDFIKFGGLAQENFVLLTADPREFAACKDMPNLYPFSLDLKLSDKGVYEQVQEALANYGKLEAFEQTRKKDEVSPPKRPFFSSPEPSLIKKLKSKEDSSAPSLT